MRAAVLSVALIACAYRPGSFSHFQQDFPGQRTTVGCIDLAVQRRPALTGTTVIAYEFGNRCDRPATIDLANVTVRARTYDGRELHLTPYDPDAQLRPLPIDGRAAGREAIEYLAEERVAEICIDIASLTQQTPARWTCMADPLPPPQIAESTR